MKVLRNRNYRMWLIGLTVAHVGTWMQRIAQDWLVLELTGESGTALGIVTGLQFLPLLLLGPVGGVIADRFSKRRTLLCTQAAVGACALALGAAVLTGSASIGIVYAVSAALGVAAAVFHPTVQAFVVELVDRDDVPRAVALSAAAFQAARLVGPAVAGGAIVLGGTGPVFTAAALTVAFPIAALLRMDASRLRPAPSAGGGPGMFAEGVRYALTAPQVRLLLLITLFTGAFAANTQVTTALMATTEFGRGAGEFGLLGSLLAAGSLLGSAAVVLSGRSGPRFVAAAALAFCAANAASALAPGFGSFAAVLVAVGAAQLVFTTAANASLQLGADPRMRGRVMALFTMFMMGSTPLGAPLLGVVADAVGARGALLAGAGAAAAGVLIAAALLLPGAVRAARESPHTESERT
ncbi:MFS transporter [Nocardiopsis sp. RSe5-2]|uniref:MFS transporter n=1 Tax=Nocardiopsis endophytica TaxID=3018445 RepID=A0ABT4U7P8_9ACTN|nr:MFS transporter [Nocardiopsis endophytica]MDA2812981.1 MFS transporter [Nocardiopsis endophytica]